MRVRLLAKLNDGLDPSLLVVTDESARHAGHAAARPEEETHFHIRIVSEQFCGLTLIERHRRVYTLLADELASSIHALALETKTSEEVENATQD